MTTKPKLPPGPLQKTCADPRLAAFFSAQLNYILSIFNRQHSLHQPGSHKPSHKHHSSTFVITGLHAYFLHRMGFRVRETRYLLGSATLYRVWCTLFFPCLVSPTIEMGIIIHVPELLRSQQNKGCQVQKQLPETNQMHIYKTLLSPSCVHGHSSNI